MGLSGSESVCQGLSPAGLRRPRGTLQHDPALRLVPRGHGRGNETLGQRLHNRACWGLVPLRSTEASPPAPPGKLTHYQSWGCFERCSRLGVEENDADVSIHC